MAIPQSVNARAEILNGYIGNIEAGMQEIVNHLVKRRVSLQIVVYTDVIIWKACTNINSIRIHVYYCNTHTYMHIMTSYICILTTDYRQMLTNKYFLALED